MTRWAAPGQRSKLSDDHRRALAEMVEAGPIPAIHGVVRWRLVDLAHWMANKLAQVTVRCDTAPSDLVARWLRLREGCVIDSGP